MAKLSSIKTDPQLESEGIWVEYELGISLRIARVGNPAYTKLLGHLTRPHQRLIRADKFPEEKMSELTKQAMAKHVLVDWKGIDEEEDFETREAALEAFPDVEPREEDGRWYVPVPYSSERALAWFMDPEMRDFYRFVLVMSNEVELFRVQYQSESAKN